MISALLHYAILYILPHFEFIDFLCEGYLLWSLYRSFLPSLLDMFDPSRRRFSSSFSCPGIRSLHQFDVIYIHSSFFASPSFVLGDIYIYFLLPQIVSYRVSLLIKSYCLEHSSQICRIVFALQPSRTPSGFCAEGIVCYLFPCLLQGIDFLLPNLYPFFIGFVPHNSIRRV